MNHVRVVFMGTPDFSVPCLKKLIDDGHEVAAVVTQPDRPRGRGQKMQYSPVKEEALRHGVDVLQPKRVRETDFVAKTKEIDPEVIVVVAFGQIIPAAILDTPKYGCINVHGSLLPKYRGASPIQAAIAAGERVTGVTTMYMDVGLDTGDMIFKSELEIMDSDNAGTVHDKMAALGADLLGKTLDAIEKGTAPRIPQDGSMATYAPKLSKENGRIKWESSASEIFNQVRAMNPWPGAYTYFRDKLIKVYGTNLIADTPSSEVPGTVLELTDRGPRLATGEESIVLEAVQLPGKRVISGCDINNGLRLSRGDRFLNEAKGLEDGK